MELTYSSEYLRLGSHVQHVTLPVSGNCSSITIWRNSQTSSRVTAYSPYFNRIFTVFNSPTLNFELPYYTRIFWKLRIRRIFLREFTVFNSLEIDLIRPHYNSLDPSQTSFRHRGVLISPPDLIRYHQHKIQLDSTKPHEINFTIVVWLRAFYFPMRSIQTSRWSLRPKFQKKIHR